MVRKPCLFNLTNVVRDHKLLEFYDIDVKLIKNNIVFLYPLTWKTSFTRFICFTKVMFVCEKYSMLNKDHSKSMYLCKNGSNMYTFFNAKTNVQVKINASMCICIWACTKWRTHNLTFMHKWGKGKWTKFLVVNIHMSTLHGFFSQRFIYC